MDSVRIVFPSWIKVQVDRVQSAVLHCPCRISLGAAQTSRALAGAMAFYLSVYDCWLSGSWWPGEIEQPSISRELREGKGHGSSGHIGGHSDHNGIDRAVHGFPSRRIVGLQGSLPLHERALPTRDRACQTGCYRLETWPIAHRETLGSRADPSSPDACMVGLAEYWSPNCTLWCRVSYYISHRHGSRDGFQFMNVDFMLPHLSC